MAGDLQNTNKIAIGLESVIFLTSLFFVFLHIVLEFFVPWITPISWIVFLGTIGFFIVRLIVNINN